MSFTNIFGGTVIWPSDVTYLALSLTADTTLEWPLEAATGSDLVARIIDVTPTGEHTITMPPADETGTGQTVLFNNIGPDDVHIVDNASGALLTLAQGEVWQIYLTANATAAGTWRTFQYGASTAQAQAAALAGPGLVAIGSTLGQSMTMSTINTTPYTLAAGDRAQGFVWIGAAGTFNLPATATAGNNWFVNVRNGGTGALTIDPSGAETINDEATLVMNPGDSAVIATDGLEWWTVGLGKQAIFAFDYTTIDLAGLSGTYTLSGAELNRIAYEFTGALAGNIVIEVPATVQQYWVTNSATGFTLALQTVGGSTPVNLASGDQSIFYSNGAEVVLAVTTSGIATPIAIADGGTNATSAANARSNLGAAGNGNNSDITALQGLTAAQVAVTFSSDTNTGYGRGAADTLEGQVGGSRAFQIEGAANGTKNTILGAAAAASMAAAQNCAALGDQALRVATGASNTSVGCNSAFSLTTGTSNTFLGSGCGTGLTTGSNNTLIGASATASSASASNSVTLGNSSISVLRCNQTTISSLSDMRDKNDIEPLPEMWSFVRELTPSCWTWNRRDGSMKGSIGWGFIAQWLQDAEQASGFEVPGLVYEENPDKLEVGPAALIPVLVKVINEMQERLEALEARLG